MYSNNVIETYSDSYFKFNEFQLSDVTEYLIDAKRETQYQSVESIPFDKFNFITGEDFPVIHCPTGLWRPDYKKCMDIKDTYWQKTETLRKEFRVDLGTGYLNDGDVVPDNRPQAVTVWFRGNNYISNVGNTHTGTVYSVSDDGSANCAKMRLDWVTRGYYVTTTFTRAHRIHWYMNDKNSEEDPSGNQFRCHNYWCFWTMLRDNSKIKLYLGEYQVTNTDYTDGGTLGTNRKFRREFHVGGLNSGGEQNKFPGYIDDLRFYDNAVIGLTDIKRIMLR